MTFRYARMLVAMAAGVLLAARTSAADRQIRPFVGATFAGSTTFVDTENAVGQADVSIGASAVFLGELFGAEIDAGDTSGFFQSGDQHLVLGSRVTTFSGNVVIAAPHRRTEYSLRPYVIAGGGLMRVHTTTSFNVFDINEVLPHFDVGAGAVGFLTNRVGVAWDLRRFQSLHGATNTPVAPFGEEKLSFWRATMSFVIRY
jgi:hypothetical protein